MGRLTNIYPNKYPVNCKNMKKNMLIGLEALFFSFTYDSNQNIAFL